MAFTQRGAACGRDEQRPCQHWSFLHVPSRHSLCWAARPLSRRKIRNDCIWFLSSLPGLAGALVPSYQSRVVLCSPRGTHPEHGPPRARLAGGGGGAVEAFCPSLNNPVRSGRLARCEKGEDPLRSFCRTDRDLDASATPPGGCGRVQGAEEGREGRS